MSVQPSAATHDAGDGPATISGDSQFDQLRDFVDRAANGEIDLEIGHTHALAPDGKLPAGWYALPEPAPPERRVGAPLRPEFVAGLLGLAAGLVLLIPVAVWWQRPGIPHMTAMDATSASSPISSFVDARSSADARVDILAVRSVPVGKSVDDEIVAEARSMLVDGEVLAARALLSKPVAARHPDGLFLMAETYDPNLLAAHRARGVGADTERARALYAAAQSLGHARAASRLDALK